MRSTVYNKGMSRFYDQASAENRALVDEFVNYCRSCDKSPQSIYQYHSYLKVFFSWNYAENGDKPFVTLRKRDFIRFVAYLREKNSSPKRIKALLSGLSSFSNMIEQLYDVEYPTFRNQLRGLNTGSNDTVREKTILSLADVQRMLDQLVEAEQYQAACYLAMACASGARKAELIQFKTEWFDESHLVFNGYMYKTDKIRTKGHGVKGKEIPKYVIRELADPYYKIWMAERARLGIESEYVFVRQSGLPADVSFADKLCVIISETYGIDFYSHSARHFFCTHLKDLGYPDEIIRMIVGWESADLVRTYNDTTDEVSLARFFQNLQGGNE